jgi:hypothetical protein
MIIWFALCIPVLAAIFMLVFFRRKIVWWEFLIPLGVSIVLVVIFKLTITAVQTSDTEYWGGYVVKAQYFEDWNEYIHQTCTRSVYAGTDSKGNAIYKTETYDCSYVQYHPEEWHVVDNNDIDISISQSEYQRLVRQFGHEPVFIDLSRHYHTDDGDMYQVEWDNNQATFEPVTTVHFYENRVQAASSVFHFPDVDDSTKARDGLFDYPKVTDNLRVPGILGPPLPGLDEAERKLDYLNAMLGAPKQVRVWILVFRNKPIEVGHAQEWLWKGGNKNEFTLTIGIDDNDAVQWVYPISWTPVEKLKVDARYAVQNMKPLRLTDVVDWLGPNIEQYWVRKPFKEFSYLTVEPPTWSIAMTYIITLLVNIALSWWAVRNEYTPEEESRSSRW